MALFKINSQNIEEGAITQELFDVTVSESISSLKISNVSIANSTYHVLDDTAVNIGGGYIVVTGSGFTANTVVAVGSASALSTSYVNSTTLHVEIGAASARTYDLYVSNSDGDVALKKNGVTYSGSPTWITASSLNSVINAVSFTGSFSATGATSYSNTTSLPTGFNLVSANGYYYGTIEIESDTTYNFTIRATDAEAQDSDRAFSLDAITAIPVEYLVVAGGGAGGAAASGGGGGAGGLLTGTSYIIPDGTTYTVTVGSGGSGWSNGSNSSFNNILCFGGGRGGNDNPNEYSGYPGGSGGGGADRSVPGGLGTPGQGNDGGDGIALWDDQFKGEWAGGGGGAGEPGDDAAGGNSGDGGNGLISSITGTAVYYAGGGGAGPDAPGGLGGGGNGSGYNVGGNPGGVNTGGGGGGGYSNRGAGGSGIIVLRHADSYTQATTTGSPTITTSGGYKIYKFTGSGSITW